MLCVHIYIFNRKISATFDSEKQYSVIQEAKDNMKKHLLCLITTILIAASLNAQPNYNYEKLQREDLGRGGCYPQGCVYRHRILEIPLVRPHGYRVQRIS